MCLSGQTSVFRVPTARGGGSAGLHELAKGSKFTMLKILMIFFNWLRLGPSDCTSEIRLDNFVVPMQCPEKIELAHKVLLKDESQSSLTSGSQKWYRQ